MYEVNLAIYEKELVHSLNVAQSSSRPDVGRVRMLIALLQRTRQSLSEGIETVQFPEMPFI